MKIAERDDRIFTLRLEPFLALRQLVRVRAERLGQPLVQNNGHADIFFADELFELVDGQQQTLGLRPRNGVKPALGRTRLCKMCDDLDRRDLRLGRVERDPQI